MIRNPTSTMALALGSLVLAGCGENTAPTQPETAGDQALAIAAAALPHNSWTTRAAFPAPVFGLALGADLNSAGQRITYAFGGHINEFQYSSILAYNHVTNIWTAKAARLGRSFTNGVGKIGGKLYISGGYDVSGGLGLSAETMHRELWAYDPAGDRIIKKADMPLKTASGTTGVINGKLYVLPGACAVLTLPPEIAECDAETVRSFFFRYDPVTNSWSNLAPSPRLHSRGVGGVINGKFYVAGPGTALDVYDPFSNTWKTLAPLPAPRVTLTGGIMNGKLWVVGANGSNRNTYAYDPVTNTWKTRAPVPTGGASQAAIALPFDGQSHLFVVGGASDTEEGVPSLLYTP
jgi:N-acetylneuraminic acid mutarotase